MRSATGRAPVRACRVALAQVGVLAAVIALAPPASAQPNIVVITSDDQNFRDFGFTGDCSVKDNTGAPVRPLTPTIDAMFTQGVTFAMGHVPHAVCRPSLVSLMTGMNPVQNGVYGNDPVANGSAIGWGQNQDNLYNNIMRRNMELNATLPRLLAERGYLCLQTGKWWEGDPKRAGFTHAEPGYETTNAARHLNNYGDNGAGSIGRATNSVTTRIGAFVDQAIAADKPFFVSYAPFLPHSPFNAPSAYTGRYTALINAGKINAQQASYLACIDWLDATMAELRAMLQAKGVENDTVYVFMVDNGWLQPATGTIPSYGGNGAKMTPFQNGVRTPIIFFQPGRITDARPIAQKLADTRLASSIDIMPTLLKLAGVQAPETLQGIDLLSSLALHTRRRCFGDSYKHDQDTMISNTYRVGNPEGTLTSRWVIQDGWKLLLVNANPVGQSIGAATQLYNLRADPLETTNRAITEPARVASMSATLLDWWVRTRPVYIYNHEFNGDGTSVAAATVDVRDA
ncbi:MAG: sulfatase-like hydrolase/transferase, partial [Phycisphaerales bacterium]|nr:sulfatase-like hydrolase/transferase [Phycisphaerales bacterium]